MFVGGPVEFWVGLVGGGHLVDLLMDVVKELDIKWDHVVRRA